MDYLDQLRNGSKFHKVAPILNGFKIYAAFDDEDCIEKFHNIVVQAIEHAASGGYEIDPIIAAQTRSGDMISRSLPPAQRPRPGLTRFRNRLLGPFKLGPCHF